MTSVPRFISVDDHVIEPRDLWQSRLPKKYRDVAPRVVRTKGRMIEWTGKWEFEENLDHPDAQIADMWIYEDTKVFLQKASVAAGHDLANRDSHAVSYDEVDMRPGCFNRDARLADMDLNHTEVQICFPSISRFCGQFFLNRHDPELALECIRTYNDWMIDEWCGDSGHGRLVPLTLIPLWDPELAAVEVRRCAEKGSHAVAFSEAPTNLAFPSLYTRHWDPFIAACQDTDTVINMHVGSSSKAAQTSPDSPHIASLVVLFEYGMHGLINWVMSGTLARFPRLRIVMSEAQVGWVPYVLERMDKLWKRRDPMDLITIEALSAPPSSYVRDQVFGSIFDDVHGLASRDELGASQLMFETDYPHADSTWPNSVAVAETLVREAGLSEAESHQFFRGNAVRCFGLDKYFGISA